MKSLLCYLIIVSLLGSTSQEDGSEDSPQILSFTFEVWDPFEEQWKSSTDVEKGNDIRLICTIDLHISHTFKIKKQHEANALEPLIFPNSRQITHVFRNLECGKTGIYMCEGGLNAIKSIELGIFNCEPRFCDVEEKSRNTVFVALNQAQTFSVCVLAYPDISVAQVTPNFARRSFEMRAGSSGITNMPVTVNKTRVHNTWKYDFESDPDNFGAYTVNMTKTNVSLDDYGEHFFAIFTSHRGHRKQLNFTLVLQPLVDDHFSPDPPDCPTDIKVFGRGVDNITLAWTPGLGRGSDQCFHVFFSTDNQTWNKFGESTEQSLVTISGLRENTEYSFRVISANKCTEIINEPWCKEIVYGKTENLSFFPKTLNTTPGDITEDNETSSPSKTAIWVLAAVLILIFVVIVVVIVFILCLKAGILLCIERDRLYYDARRPVAANEDDPLSGNRSEAHIYSEIE